MNANLLRAAGRACLSSVSMTLLIAAMTAGVVIVTLATAGRTVAGEQAVLATIDDEAVTTIDIIDDQGNAGLYATYLQDIQGLSTVTWAVGLGEIDDVRPLGLPGADAVASRLLLGSSPSLRIRSDLRTVSREIATTPVAVAGIRAQQQLGLTEPAGAVATFGGVQTPIVGSLTATDPLQELNNQVLIVDPDFDGPLRRLILQVDSPAHVDQTARAVAQLSPSPNIRVVVADDLVRIRAAVQGELGGAGRGAVLQTMAAMLILTTLVLYASLHARRKDFGRRRALGATRAQLVGIVLGHVALAALPGAIIGAGIGSVVIYWLTGSLVGIAYPTAVAILALLTAVLAATPPAFIAAQRDPVSALRVP